MADYTALVAEWATITTANPSFTTAQKLAAVNALTVAGLNVDVSASAVLGYLMLNVKLGGLQAYVASPPSGSSSTAIALVKELLAAFGYPAFGLFETSNATIYSTVGEMLTTISSDANTGITSGDVSAIMALAQTTIPWWKATVAQGGGGLSSPVGMSDLSAAPGGLT